MQDDPQPKGGDAQPQQAEGNPLPLSDPRSASPGAGEEQDAKAGEGDPKTGKGPLRRLLERINLNETVATVIAVSSLVVAIRGCQISDDNSDIKAAIGNLSALATQTKRQADASSQQVAVLSAQLEASRRQAGSAAVLASAAGEQVDAMRSQNRPWIAIEEGNVAHPGLTEDGSRGYISLSLKVTASGARPALGVSAIATTVLSTDNVAGEQMRLCKVRRQPVDPDGIAYAGATVFPGDHATLTANTEVSANLIRRYSGKASQSVVVVGCVLYSEANGARHGTGFRYLITGTAGRIDDREGLHWGTPRVFYNQAIKIVPDPSGPGTIY